MNVVDENERLTFFNVVTQKRNRLDPEKVESCVIVKTNLSLLREMGLKK